MMVALLLASSASSAGHTAPPPGPGVMTQPLGYSVWAAKGGAPARTSRRPLTPAHAAGSGNGCAMVPGPYPTMQVCGGNGALYGFRVPHDPDHRHAAVSAAQLALTAFRHLVVPAPSVATAPPRGKPGVVGLRQFYWVPREQWRPIMRSADSGSVWARVTAQPTQLIIHPGDGSSVACRGPGTPYVQDRSPDEQAPGCGHVYQQSSAGQPGAAYRVRAELVWTATWSGSGGAGGPLPSRTRSTSFPLQVAEAQALIQRSS